MHVCMYVYVVFKNNYLSDMPVADIRLWFNGLSTEQKIHVVRPNVALTLCAKGEILNSQDEVGTCSVCMYVCMYVCIVF